MQHNVFYIFILSFECNLVIILRAFAIVGLLGGVFMYLSMHTLTPKVVLSIHKTTWENTTFLLNYLCTSIIFCSVHGAAPIKGTSMWTNIYMLIAHWNLHVCVCLLGRGVIERSNVYRL